jgi:hypothetical protein
MSSKLIIEFYDGTSSSEPVAVLLAFHGGEEPEAAALTVSAFLTQIREPPNADETDARELATRFIDWQQSMEGDLVDGKCPAAILINPEHSYGYQLAIIYVDNSGVSADIVADEYTTTEEMDSAEAILSVA